MSKWTTFRDRCVASVLAWLGVDLSDIARKAGEAADAAASLAGGADTTPAADTATGARAAGAPPPWDAATLASCWGGTNASKRCMNVLSPKMTDKTFGEYVSWMLQQGANTAHVFLVNRGDEEYAGYSPWGTGKGPSAGEPDQQTVQLMNGRMSALRDAGLAVVVWLCADDSSDWAKALAKNADTCLRWIASDGLLGDASTVVLGLEMDEYWDKSQAKAVAAATRKVFAGKIGVHHTSGRADYASLGDILFYQVQPGRSAAQIKSDTAAALRHGKPVNFFELDRGPNKTLAQAALDAGAYGVGNCAPGVVAKGAAQPAAAAAETAGAADDVAASSLDWRYGGFDGSRAALDTRCRIGSLRVENPSKLALKWLSGVPADWARSDDGFVVCALFFRQGGRWVGGKFEWIDDDRSTRDLKNVKAGYNGWDAAAYLAADKHALCIVSKDGKKRSNIITD